MAARERVHLATVDGWLPGIVAVDRERICVAISRSEMTTERYFRGAKGDNRSESYKPGAMRTSLPEEVLGSPSSVM